jgi:hypothetical protein
MRLLLLHYTPHPAAVRLTTEQHLGALAAVSNADVLTYNAVHGAPAWLRHLRFDAIVLHTTLLAMRWNVWFPQWRRRLDWLAETAALKVAFPQDEYDHAEVHDRWLDELGVSIVATVLDDRHRTELYPRLSRTAAFYEVLTGYVDDAAAVRIRGRLRSGGERPYDVVYRARHLPYWYGSHGQLKHAIGDSVLARAGAHGMRCDISTRATETVFGAAWLELLASGRATVGVESGVSVLDRRGEVRERVAELLADEPSATFDEIDARMPPGWDDYRFFAVSPRHLEAVVTRTAQMLVEGRYSGVLEPERHYLPVRRDLSNLDETLERSRDHHLLERLAAQAYADVYESGRFSSRRLTEMLERILDEHAPVRARPPGPAFRVAERLATAESHAERVVLAPVSNVARVGRAGVSEMLAGLRLVAVDAEVRALLVEYLRSTEMREHVSPRQALADLLCLGALRRGDDGARRFSVRAELDEAGRRMILRSHAPGETDGRVAVSAGDLQELLRRTAVDFLWDHSRIGRSVVFPLAGSGSLELPLPAGPHPLPALNWLGRKRPAKVAAALAPVLAPPRS